MEKLVTDSNPPEEEGWQIKIANLISGGAVDEARAILAIDKSMHQEVQKKQVQ